MFSYDDGSFEGSLVVRRQEKRPDDGAGHWYSDLTDEEQAQENLRRADRRAVLQLKRYIRHHSLTRLITLTNGDNASFGWSCRSGALSDCSEWLQAEGHALLGGGALAAVAEQGERGGRWHVHLAIAGGFRLDYRRIIRSYSAFMEGRGWHSSTGTHRFHAGDEAGKHKGGFSSARVCSEYMAKYLTKSLRQSVEEKHLNRYRVYGGSTPKPSYAERLPSLRSGLRTLGFCVLSPEVTPLIYESPDGYRTCYGFVFDVGG